MKKTYNAPETKVYNVKVANIMAGSFDNVQNSVGYSEDAGGYAKKGNSVWSFMDGEEEE